MEGGGGTIAQWQKVFYITAAVLFVGGTVFLMFALGKEQAWANGPPGGQEESEKPSKQEHGNIQNVRDLVSPDH